jgi:hypothetical protein
MFYMILCINVYMGDPARLSDVAGVVVIAARATLAFTPNLWSERTFFPSSSLIAILNALLEFFHTVNSIGPSSRACEAITIVSIILDYCFL